MQVGVAEVKKMSMAHRLYISYPRNIPVLKTWEKICDTVGQYGTLEKMRYFIRYGPYKEYEFTEINSQIEEYIRKVKRWELTRDWWDNIYWEKKEFSDRIAFYNQASPIDKGRELPNPLDDEFACRIYLRHFYGLTIEEHSKILNLTKDITINTNPTRIIPGNNAVQHKYKCAETPTGIHMISLDSKFADPKLEYKITSSEFRHIFAYYKNIDVITNIICDIFDMRIPSLTDKEKEDIIEIIKENSYNMEIIENGGIFIQTGPNIETWNEVIKSPHKTIAEYLKTLQTK